MPSVMREFWLRTIARRTGARDEELSRGVSKRARRHVVKIRMAACDSTRDQLRPDTGSLQNKRITRLGKMWGPSDDTAGAASRLETLSLPCARGDNTNTAVAVKITRKSLVGRLRHGRVRDELVYIPAGQSCVICLEIFRPGDILAILLCQHMYHERCINRWLGDHTSCCVCKADLEEMAEAASRATPSRKGGIGIQSDARAERGETEAGLEVQYRGSRSAPDSNSLTAQARTSTRSNERSVSVLARRARFFRSATHSPGRDTSHSARAPNIQRQGQSRGTSSSSSGASSGQIQSAGAFSASRRTQAPTSPPEWNLGSTGSDEGSSSSGGNSNRSGSNSRTSSSSSDSFGSVETACGGDDGGEGAAVAHTRPRPASAQVTAAAGSTPPTAPDLQLRRTCAASPQQARPRALSPRFRSSVHRASAAFSRHQSSDSPARSSSQRISTGLPPPLSGTPASLRRPAAQRASAIPFSPSVATLSTPQRMRRVPRRAMSLEAYSALAQMNTPRQENGESTPIVRMSPCPFDSSDRKAVAPARQPLAVENRTCRRTEEALRRHRPRSAGFASFEATSLGDVGNLHQNQVPGRQDRAISLDLPRGHLDDWAKAKPEEEWLQGLGKSPKSESESENMTCSTQWSEMESQLSAGSGRSTAGENSSILSGYSARSRIVSAAAAAANTPIPASPRRSVPVVAEAKRTPAAAGAHQASRTARQDYLMGHARGVQARGSHTENVRVQRVSRSSTPRPRCKRLGARSRSAPIIWDDVCGGRDGPSSEQA